jgi:hypothetical protein
VVFRCREEQVSVSVELDLGEDALLSHELTNLSTRKRFKDKIKRTFPKRRIGLIVSIGIVTCAWA